MQENGENHQFAVVVVGVSAGGLEALKQLLGSLPGDFPLPLLIVQHLRPEDDGQLALCLQRFSALLLKEAVEGERMAAGTVYFAPANYHLLVEQGGFLALSVDRRVCYARPSVDVLFESAADVFGPAVIGVVLTGANDDGSKGLLRIKTAGGIAIVQDPDDAAINQMPLSALRAVDADYVLPLTQIHLQLQQLATGTCLVADRERKKP